jgi:DNA-binding NtrC family response regulator
VKNTSKKCNIVIIEDDLDTRDLLIAFLKPKGFNVIFFNCADDMLETTSSIDNEWDLLISDLEDDNTSNDEIVYKINNSFPNLPIIPMTTNNLLDLKEIRKAINLALCLSENNSASPNIATLEENPIINISSINSHANTATNVIGNTPKFIQALSLARRVAQNNSNILILGESGTGKEVFAKYIHSESKSKNGNYVAINCAAIPEHLLESELFGHSKGAFTGAQEKRIGLFEEAQDGTLFLDEIGDLGLSVQAKLLRVLQDRTIRRVGDNESRPVNCRVISATHRDLAKDVNEGKFREDLFFRLNVIPITIPPLRERNNDILLLAETFLTKYAKQNNSLARSLSSQTIHHLLHHIWPGNVRELENTIERAVVLCDQHEIQLEHIIPKQRHKSSSINLSENSKFDDKAFFVRYEEHLPTLNEVIHKYITFAVDKNDGARDKTAVELGIDRKTLYKRLNSFENSNM